MHQTQPELVDITNQLLIGQPWHDSTGNAELTRTDSHNLVVSFFESGIKLELTGWGSFRAFVPRTYENRIQGFLGNLDRNLDNEFHTRENAIVHLNNNHEIFPHLQAQCKSYMSTVVARSDFLICYRETS